MPSLPSTCEVAIIGAGFSGLCTAIRLSRTSTDFIVLEREDGLGGVWRQNTYPGAACDVASALYSFSFENDYDWPRTHGTHQDIIAYMEHCTHKYGVADKLAFGTDVQRLDWDAAGQRWNIHTNKGVLSARFVISACGLFSKPVIPATPGLDQFEGPVIHSADWDHSFDPTGKTLAVVGNGCSAAQIVPAIIDSAEKIYLTMRSPVHVITKAERTYTPDERELYRRFPLLRALDRQNFIRKSIELADLPLSADARDRITPAILATMARQLTDADKRTLALPDYPVMAKRPIRSDDYLPALDREKVAILRTTINRLTRNTMVTADQREFAIDALIFATGFEASEYLVPLEVFGREGVRLHDIWREGAQAYYGMLVPGFPNFIMIYGPNTNVVGSILQVIEPQVEAALEMMRVATAKRSCVEIAAEPADAFNELIQAKLAESVWGLNAATNYFTAKSGRIVTQWPGTFLEFQNDLAAIDWTSALAGSHGADQLQSASTAPA